MVSFYLLKSLKYVYVGLYRIKSTCYFQGGLSASYGSPNVSIEFR